MLAACEGIHRSGKVDPRLASVLGGGGGVGDLRALADDSVVAELVALAARAREQGLVEKLRGTADTVGHLDVDAPLGVAAPVLVPGWADGVLLVGSAEATMLVNVKTVIILADPRRAGRSWPTRGWTAWTCTHNRTVGLYLARHGVLVAWSARTLAGAPLGNNKTPA